MKKVSKQIYTIELDSRNTKFTDDGIEYLSVIKNGEELKVTDNTFEFTTPENVKLYSYNDVLEIYKGTKGIRTINGKFKL